MDNLLIRFVLNCIDIVNIPLVQYTVWESDKKTVKLHIQERQEVSSFPAESKAKI